MRSMIIKVFLLGTMFFVSNVKVFTQEVSKAAIQCEVSGVDLNLNSDNPDYRIEFGSLSVSEKDEERTITRHYKLPRTKLILSVSPYYVKKGDITSPFMKGDYLGVGMILGKKKILPSDDIGDEKLTRSVVDIAESMYPIKALGKGGKGVLTILFLGKKKPIKIMVECKKAG